MRSAAIGNRLALLYNGGMAARQPITDSPWFWVYLFGTGALIALALLTPKYGSRQAQIERQFQGRQRAAQNLNGQEPSVALSTAEQTIVSLKPLFLGLAAVTMVAWFVFYRTRLARQSAAASAEREPTETHL